MLTKLQKNNEILNFLRSNSFKNTNNDNFYLKTINNPHSISTIYTVKTALV